MRGYKQISKLSFPELERYMLNNKSTAPFYGEISVLYYELKRMIESLATTDTKDYLKCSTVTMFQQYVSKYDKPYYKGRHLEEAREEIYFAEHKEDAFDIRFYLQKYPNGKHKSWAEETKYYFEHKDSVDQLSSYLQKYPTGIYKNEADKKIKELQEVQAEKNKRIGCIIVLGILTFILLLFAAST